MEPTPPSSPYFTPLRYPGGKGKLAEYIKAIIGTNSLEDGYYAEPYAGGAAVALELLFHEFVTHIYINDVSASVGAFWRSVLNDPDRLCARIADTKVTIDEWHRQREIQDRLTEQPDLELGFSTFFLNRTNRSGILKAGVIGGKKQDGEWKMDARYNASELIRRIQAIANQKRRISFSQMDAVDFLRDIASKMPKRSLVYLDPPYFVKGRDLYHHHYTQKDHEQIARLIPRQLAKQKWIVSYDDVNEVHDLYSSSRSISYRLSYSAQTRYQGGEVMFFCDSLQIPPPCAPMRTAA